MTDGTSNTAVVGERAWTVSGAGGVRDCNAGVVFGMTDDEMNSPTLGQSYMLAGGEVRINAAGPAAGAVGGALTNAECARGYSSRHAGGAQFLLGDGAVRFVSENVEHNVDVPVNSAFEAILGVNDGVVVGEF